MRVLVIAIGLAGCGRVGFGILGADAVMTTGFDDTDFTTCPTDLVFQGDASCVGGYLQITPSSPEAAGEIWTSSPYPISHTTRISMELAFQFTNGTPLAADGITIAFQNDPRGSGATTASSGGYLGFDTITPSTAFELDTYQNLTNGIDDPDSNHVGFDRDGLLDSIVTVDPSFTLSGSTFHVWLDYDGPSTMMTAYVDLSATKPTTPLIAFAEDLTRLGDHAWIGLTGATGSTSEEHDVLAWSLALTY